MATVYFKQSLVNTALTLINIKGASDKAKAKNDIDQIDSILKNYFAGYWYDVITAQQLDDRLVREYPIIENFKNLLPPTVSCISKNNSFSTIDPVISNLNQDRYCIMFEVLLKEGIVQKLDDFVDRVE